MPLFIVATPIGNLEDITLRALRVLKEADEIVCEDTRVTKKLLDHYGIQKDHLISYRERSGFRQLAYVVSLLEQKKSVAYVTDAGTPGISDPGNQLVAEVAKRCQKTGLKEYEAIISIPGPSALAAAISIAGFYLQEFRFIGFLPHKKGRKTKVREIIKSDIPVVLYESVHRMKQFLTELGEAGFEQNRQIVVANDLTKMFERVCRGNLEEVTKELKAHPVKGEFVVIIDRTKDTS